MINVCKDHVNTCGVNEYVLTIKRSCRICCRLYSAKYRNNNKEHIKSKNNKRQKYYADNITDCYVTSQLKKEGISYENVTPQLIAFRREFIKANRTLKQERKQCHNIQSKTV